MTFEGAAALALAPIAFVGGLIQGLTGFGSALITIPLATYFVPLPFALAVFSIVDFANGMRLGLEHPKNAVAADIARMVPMMILGIVTGTTLLVNLPRKASLVALGTFVFGYALYTLWRRGPAAHVGRHWAFVAGFCGGLSGTLFGSGGPPYAIYLLHRSLSKDQFRATMTLTIIFSIGLRLVAFALTGLLTQDGVWLAAAAAVPAGLVAIYLASRLFHAISREAVMRGVAILLLASGASLIARGLG
jgi:uncharacterized membrane protein YfcA